MKSIIKKFTAPLYSYEEYNLEKKIINKVALIDADRYKHLVTYRVFQKITEEGLVHNKALLNDIIDSYLARDIFNCFEARAYVFCFSAPSKNVFRNHIAQVKEYKGNRRNKVDPNFYTGKYEDMVYVYEYIKSRYHTLYCDDLEADDLLSMIQNEDTFIFSHDKDLMQVPGNHWDIEKHKIISISKESSFKSLLYQLMTGDTTDNITGLKGFGAKTLEKEILIMKGMSLENQLKHVLDLYILKHGIVNGFDEMTEMWNLLSLKKNRGDYFKEKYKKAFSTIQVLINE